MLSTKSTSLPNYKTRIYSLASQPNILVIKEDTKILLRSGIVVQVNPVRILSLLTLVELFKPPISISLVVSLSKESVTDVYSCVFYLDLDISNASQDDFNALLKESINYHKQKTQLLLKNIEITDLQGIKLRNKELLLFMKGKTCNKIKKSAYILKLYKEKDIFRRTIFSSNKIKQLEFKRDSIIPVPEIELGKALSNRIIGVNSNVLFLTGKKEYRREIIKRILDYYTGEDNHHIIIFDFGLHLTLDKIFFRNFSFNDVLIDPFTFKESYTTNQKTIFISHISIIAKNLLRLNDREIILLEERLASFFQQTNFFSMSTFLSFISDEFQEELLNEQQPMSFETDLTNQNAGVDYTTMIKSSQAPVKSNELETLVSKIKYLNFLFNHQNKESFNIIFSKNHLDIFTITTAPDQKALFFYMFNLYYTLNEQHFKKYKFFFLEIDSLTFDHFNDFEISWLHPGLRKALYDSSDIFPVKKIFNQLETRIYTSYISNAPYSLLSQVAKENIDKLQYLPNHSLIESPDLQRLEFFKITNSTGEIQLDLPSFELFNPLVRLLYSSDIAFSFKQLFAIYGITRNLCKNLIKFNYLRKGKKDYILTDKSSLLKKSIVDYLAFQPNLSLDENDILIKISDPLVYNIFAQSNFLFTDDIEQLCTRLLASQIVNIESLNIFLLYQFLKYKMNIIDEKQLQYYLVFALQMKMDSKISYSKSQISSQNESSEIKEKIPYDSRNNNEVEVPKNTLAESLPPTKSKIDIISDYVRTEEESKDSESINYPEQLNSLLNQINKRINDELTDPKIKFPIKPIFLTMKFISSSTIDLILNDINNLNELTFSKCRMEVN